MQEIIMKFILIILIIFGVYIFYKKRALPTQMPAFPVLKY